MCVVFVVLGVIVFTAGTLVTGIQTADNFAHIAGVPYLIRDCSCENLINLAVARMAFVVAPFIAAMTSAQFEAHMAECDRKHKALMESTKDWILSPGWIQNGSEEFKPFPPEMDSTGAIRGALHTFGDTVFRGYGIVPYGWVGREAITRPVQ